MADSKVSALTAMTTPAGTEVMYIVDGSTSKKITTANIKVYTSAAPTLVGDVTLSTGNVVIGTAGKGIDFSADSSLAGMTSELLDDYEQGAWTPSYATGFGTPTYSAQVGSYVKVGNMAIVSGTITVTAGSAAGDATITLPFASASTSSAYVGKITLTGISSSYSTFFCSLPSSSSTLSLGYQTTTTTGNVTGLTLTTSHTLQFSITYLTA